MAHSTEPPKNIGELIDHIDRIREELLVIERSMENLESFPKATADATKKK